jgi:hypothetical protein
MHILMILFTFLAVSLKALTPAQVDEIGQRIWQNECKRSIDGLLSWNNGEEFISLGIGHFIWYPEEKRGPFQETFPGLLQFLYENHVAVPSWMMAAHGCPWKTKKEFLENHADSKVQELRELLVSTVALQTQFILNRWKQAELCLADGLSEEQKTHILHQLISLKQAPNGYYALLDYLNFKGEGTNLQERYKGEGWGLLQVLELMPAQPSDPVAAFVAAAKAALTRRVKNAPPERNEQRWLTGWFNRLDTYKNYKPIDN